VNISDRKLYVQALKSRSSTKEILKIKKTFPNLKTNKIEKIIKGNGKPKPRIKMTVTISRS